MTKPLTELFELKTSCPENTPPENEFIRGMNIGVYFEYTRRKPIDLATKKLIEAVEYAVGPTRDVKTPKLIQALAEFRASLEDGE